MAVTDLSISFSYVWANYCYIIEVLWDSLLPSHEVKQLWRFLCHWFTSYFIGLCRYCLKQERSPCLMTKLNCVRCFNDSLGFIKHYIAFQVWQYVDGIIIDSLLSTYDNFGPAVQNTIFICYKCGSRTLQCIMEHLPAIVICKELIFSAVLLNQESSMSLNLP